MKRDVFESCKQYFLIMEWELNAGSMELMMKTINIKALFKEMLRVVEI